MKMKMNEKKASKVYMIVVTDPSEENGQRFVGAAAPRILVWWPLHLESFIPAFCSQMFANLSRDIFVCAAMAPHLR